MHKVNLTVPFSGFYESWHSRLIDYAEESICQDDRGESMFWLSGLFRVDWCHVRTEYARYYVQSMADRFNVPLEFEALISPRHYISTTDRIFADIDSRRLYLLFRAVRSDGRLEECARCHFTSRDGFISHYPPDWREWGPFSEWDHNQYGTVLAAWLDPDGDDFRDWENSWLADELSMVGNGGCENWIWEALAEPERDKLDTLLEWLREHASEAQRRRIADIAVYSAGHDLDRLLALIPYLKRRAQRKYRTTAEMRAAMLPFSETPLGQLL